MRSIQPIYCFVFCINCFDDFRFHFNFFFLRIFIRFRRDGRDHMNNFYDRAQRLIRFCLQKKKKFFTVIVFRLLFSSFSHSKISLIIYLDIYYGSSKTTTKTIFSDFFADFYWFYFIIFLFMFYGNKCLLDLFRHTTRQKISDERTLFMIVIFLKKFIDHLVNKEKQKKFKKKSWQFIIKEMWLIVFDYHPE